MLLLWSGGKWIEDRRNKRQGIKLKMYFRSPCKKVLMIVNGKREDTYCKSIFSDKIDKIL